jgi:hypothetical protein
VLGRLTFAALVEGLVGMKSEPGGATVGDVIELYEQGRLTEIYNISSGRAGEIRSCLVRAGLIDPESRPEGERDVVQRGHHVGCGEYVRAGGA